MSTRQDAKNALAEVKTQLDVVMTHIKEVLPKHIPADRFRNVVLTAMANKPELYSVEKRSLWNACMQAAQDGLLPDGREAALVPYKDRKRGMLVAQYQPMINGIRKKARNSGELATWDVYVVHERDEFVYELGDSPFIRHRPALGERGAIIAAYSVATLKSGEKSRDVMGVDEIHKIRQLSKNSDSGPWIEHFAEMAKKTVARRHSKLLPMSTDLEDLLDRDNENESATATSPQSRNWVESLNMVAPVSDHGHEGDPETGEIIEHTEAIAKAGEK